MAPRSIQDEVWLVEPGICPKTSGAPELALLQAARLKAAAHMSGTKSRLFNGKPSEEIGVLPYHRWIASQTFAVRGNFNAALRLR
jgi:hypothetical protein